MCGYITPGPVPESVPDFGFVFGCEFRTGIVYVDVHFLRFLVFAFSPCRLSRQVYSAYARFEFYPLQRVERSTFLTLYQTQTLISGTKKVLRFRRKLKPRTCTGAF